MIYIPGNQVHRTRRLRVSKRFIFGETEERLFRDRGRRELAVGPWAEKVNILRLLLVSFLRRSFNLYIRTPGKNPASAIPRKMRQVTKPAKSFTKPVKVITMPHETTRIPM
jgi:hypothetical protein